MQVLRSKQTIIGTTPTLVATKGHMLQAWTMEQLNLTKQGCKWQQDNHVIRWIKYTKTKAQMIRK